MAKDLLERPVSLSPGGQGLPQRAIRIANVLKSQKVRSSFAYWVMIAFSFLYFFRPQDAIPGLSRIPLAKITGAIALIALIVGANKDRSKKLSREVKLILVLFAWMVLTIPFAWYKTGAFNKIFFEFSKAAIVSVTLSMTVSHIKELRRLIFVHAFGIALMTMASVIVNHRMDGRLAGVGTGEIANPNDLAMIIALSWPVCLGLLLAGRGIFRKLFWGISLLVMVYAVMGTYSRSGFLALIFGFFLCLWEFGIRGKRFAMIAGVFVCAILFLVAAPKNYSTRLKTLVGDFEKGSKDHGSAEARQELLVKSLQVTATHPVFGVGASNFPAYTGEWRVTHNTYTEFSSECGIPALILFILILRRAFWNLAQIRKLKQFMPRSEIGLFAGALRAGLGAYLVGAFFASTAFQLFPYYMVCYTMLLYKLATRSAPELAPISDRSRSQLSYWDKRPENVVPSRV